ncbi:probable leucine-rich repeat receptor-like serine/threonine-protein kinase At3g14840 isoform X3 [Juglans microcarpa x Juglans regia]|uniref:probable leucine-rich repeat receptor-like serine/threonine-protein kinase At3g14840 isoform X3 n=1 Tax=Juglans microcarpa x Juglans regia TaxID=2249226 RepID=UPI001B7D9EAB|nr:probable leucine-rich repeat receptor-like serine/threonine-protein kinase At3g14840 isoform X3 [Juglans microcarpa x Juglans regia]
MVLQTHKVPKIIFTLKTLILLLCMGVINVKAQRRLHDDEVEALKQIAAELGKKDWNFHVDPCNDTSWATPNLKLEPRTYNNYIECNCAYPGAACHVVGLYLEGQDLSGVLPTSLAKLPHITMIDLSRNYLTGTIPSEWTSLKMLEHLSTSVNKLSGRIPSYLGKITTLRYLNVENNQFSGTVPPELGKLVNLVNLILNANFLTGELPVDLTYLTNLTELRISNNNFTGRIPDFFNSWKKLQKLEIQASGLAGPIPPSISVLSDLTELRISDLLGEGSIFPNLTSMKNMDRLMLRSCNLSGQIPRNISDLMPTLQTLDLSFNRLEGNVPEFDIDDPETKLQHMFLTSNLLNGTVPDWIKRRNPDHDLDLSYNNFLEISMPPSCRDTLNLFESFSGQDSSVGECPKNLPRSKHWNSVHINCGGNEVSIGNIKYEADLDASGAANFHRTRENWGFSCTGNFWDDNSSSNAYIANNASELRMNSPELYTSACLSPLSLTYYARCLANGKYTVALHFAEIIITGNRSFSSLGRRLFDVYIQGKLELKDFDMENTAGGVDKPLVQKVEAVVSNKILHIRFHWAGKGTTTAPIRGTYGLLISAISIEINDNPPHNVKTTIFIVTGALVLALLLIFGILCWKGCIGSRISREKGETHQGFQCEENLADNMNQDKLQELPIFSLKELASATNNFHQSNKLGQGGFGPVYKGKLLDGHEIAVKRLARSSRQGLEEFMNEVVVISKLQHRNLVRLLGGCVEGEEKLLVYEYMPNKSLDAFLFDPIKQELLDWKKRFNIIEGVGHGLLYLHRDSRLKIIHRDLKASNILLDEELNPKISDFGMAKIFGGNEDQANTKRIVGTYGYMSPEYAMEGRFLEKLDVFSFGVLLLEIVSGRKNTHFYHDEGTMSLVGLVWKMWNMDNLAALVDPKISRYGFENEIFRCIQVGLLCVQEFAKDRPTVSIVISMLKTEIVDLPYPRQPGFTVNQITSENEFSYPNQKVCSINNVTVSMVHGR